MLSAASASIFARLSFFFSANPTPLASNNTHTATAIVSVFLISLPLQIDSKFTLAKNFSLNLYKTRNVEQPLGPGHLECLAIGENDIDHHLPSLHDR